MLYIVSERERILVKLLNMPRRRVLSLCSPGPGVVLVLEDFLGGIRSYWVCTFWNLWYELIDRKEVTLFQQIVFNFRSYHFIDLLFIYSFLPLYIYICVRYLYDSELVQKREFFSEISLLQGGNKMINVMLFHIGFIKRAEIFKTVQLELKKKKESLRRKSRKRRWSVLCCVGRNWFVRDFMLKDTTVWYRENKLERRRNYVVTGTGAFCVGWYQQTCSGNSYYTNANQIGSVNVLFRKHPLQHILPSKEFSTSVHFIYQKNYYTSCL